ncbi:MBL fold metallo-hydrolase [Tengunoibacter tsumagoiensis]|uniref:MBL fold hydrolase n=1 Tax=Tengunoibacter tsumagoiensis TaxID=2014871 RepID=A0A401ZY13_9CHLR|nr:MBL fold metallo-hydrolase [Tengunoibacter tsumagoiensis]GCE11744.1 MBL fold hydrolase [Tengunoibacter tsumagoiensis]
MTAVQKLSADLWQCNLPFQGEDEIIGPYLLAGNKELAIIDPGPTTTVPALLDALREAGFQPEEVTHILGTHIHLDHMGGTGTLLESMPKAQIYVHRKGAPHLVDPTKFIASATRIYQDQMQELWGEIKPVPQERIHTLDDGEILTVAGRRLEVHYTPGHAIHHVVFFDVHSGALFAGDIAGVHLPNVNYVRPPTPPPDLDLDDWFNSLDKMKRLYPDLLYLAHFGAVRNPTQHIERLREKLITWGNFILGAVRDGKSEAEITQMLKAHTEPEVVRLAGSKDILKKLELATNYSMTVQGYLRYWKKKQPDSVLS